MYKTDHFWSAYARLQCILSHNFSLTPKNLALEAVLSAFLDMPEPPTSNAPATSEDFDTHIDRLINTCSWRERSHVRLRHLHHGKIERYVAAEDAPVALVALREVRELMSPADWLLLVSIAAGATYEELSTPTASANTLRVKISRTRAKLKKAA
jgi:hypothetical protein